MRRFEFVGGTSAKFWMAKVEGTLFTVVYGRLGTDGQRKEKEFDSDAAATKEYDKKVAEKQREGYVEVAVDGGDAPAAAPIVAAAPKATKAAPVLLPLPARVADRADVEAALVTAATKTLQSLVRGIGNRSWRRRQAATQVHRALSRIAGVDVSAHAALAAAVDSATDAVLSKPSLPLTVVLRALSSLPTPAVTRAMSRWQQPSGAAAPALHVLNGLSGTFADTELAFRLGRLLVDNELTDAAALRGLIALRLFVEARFEGGWAAFVAAVASHGDIVTERRKLALAAA